MLDVGDNPEAPQPREMIDLEATYEKLENELKEVNTNAEALKKTYLELTELRHILQKTQQFFDEVNNSFVTSDAPAERTVHRTHHYPSSDSALSRVRSNQQKTMTLCSRRRSQATRHISMHFECRG